VYKSQPLPLPPAAGLRLDASPITLRVPLAAPRAAVWAALQNPALIAACVPGASLTEATPERIAGSLRLALGPIEARFAGSASLAYDAARWSGSIRGEGQDGGSSSRLAAKAVFDVAADGAERSVVTLAITYALRGALAQFGKRRLIDLLAAEIGAEIGRNLEARLRGAAPPTPARLGAGGLALRLLRRWLRGIFTPRG
jgi:carbon-monoxide dehydrogenase small subunit